LEDLFYVIRDNGIDQDYFQELFDLVLGVSDFLKEEVEKIRQGNRPSVENEELISQILDLLERMNGNDQGVNNTSTAEAANTEATTAEAANTAEATATETAAAEAATEASETSAAEPSEMPSASSEDGQKKYHLHVNLRRTARWKTSGLSCW
jgi:two-component system chemotaxis sensor kinase CheA